MVRLAELESLGLSAGQIKVYTALVESGLSGIQRLQEKTGLERRAIYDVLNKLTEKGLVSFIVERNVRKYQITHPRHLKEAIEAKQSTLEALHGKLPLINDLFVNAKPEIGAQVFRGNEAMKTLLNELLEYKESFWIGGNSGVEGNTNENLATWFQHWDDRRVEVKHMMHDLVDHGTFLEKYGKKTNKKRLYYYQQLPKHLSSPMVVIIFGNKVAQVLWAKQSFAFVIESEEVKDSFMKYFHYFWKESKKK